MAVVHKRRAAITALPLYHSGPLLKKYTEKKDFKKYFAELRGSSLFLYEDDMQETYTEQLDLLGLKCMLTGSPSRGRRAVVFTLRLHRDEVQLKMDNPAAADVWRGFIMTVARKAIPSNLGLLPGQMLRLEEVLVQENERRAPTATLPPLPPRPSFLTSTSSPPSKDKHASEMPACFYTMTRQEAEQMLEENPECGNVVLRPSSLANNYALTVRVIHPTRGTLMRNFWVAAVEEGFIIELDTPVSAASLDEVLQCFFQLTAFRLYPFNKSQPYSTRIDLSPAPEYITISSTTPRLVPRAQVAPMVQSQPEERDASPPSKEAEGDYIVPDEDEPKPGVCGKKGMTATKETHL